MQPQRSQGRGAFRKFPSSGETFTLGLRGIKAFGDTSRFDEPNGLPPLTAQAKHLALLFVVGRQRAKASQDVLGWRDWILSDHLALI